MPHTIEDLIKGYLKFRNDYYLQSNPLFEQLVSQGQQPKILVVACSDSRVDPALILNTRPGDLFVVRNVANLIPRYEADDHFHGTSAALEFGVCGLKIKHIIVLGHTLCGGIESLVIHSKAIESKQFITKWMKLAEPAYEI